MTDVPTRRSFFSDEQGKNRAEEQAKTSGTTVLCDDFRCRGPADPKVLRMTSSAAMPRYYNVLFLCTGNSARSIMAEAILNAKGKPIFRAYSAGSHPSGRVRPEALERLEASHISTAGLRSKNWDEFAQPGGPKLDFVFTVCDNAAREVCPVWPGQPMTAHWGVPDPAAVEGPPQEIERAFRNAFTMLERRISLFLSLPLTSIDRLALKKELDQIGHEP